MKATRCYFCLFSLLFLISPTAQAQDTSATTKGTAIGQTLNAAFTAALPGVSAIGNIIAALFNKPAAAVTPTATTKVTAQAVTTAITDATKTLQSNAQDQLTALQGAIAEIAAANALAAAAQTANISLPSKAFLNIPGGMDAFKNQWSVAKTNINKLTTFNPTQLGKITNESVLDSWKALTDSYTQWANDVETTIVNQTSVTSAAYTIGIPSFDSLSKSIQDLTRIPGIELQQLASQLSAVKAVAATGTGTSPPPPPPLPNNNGPLGTFIKSTVGKL
jgi:hypothetical protein